MRLQTRTASWTKSSQTSSFAHLGPPCFHEQPLSAGTRLICRPMSRCLNLEWLRTYPSPSTLPTSQNAVSSSYHATSCKSPRGRAEKAGPLRCFPSNLSLHQSDNSNYGVLAGVAVNLGRCLGHKKDFLDPLKSHYVEISTLPTVSQADSHGKKQISRGKL